MKEVLLDLGNYVTTFGEKLGASQIEAYLESTRIIEFKIEKGLIRLASDNLDTGCGIRTTIGNQLGISYVTSISKKDLETAVRDAINAAKSSVPDTDFKSFAPVQSVYPQIKGLFDREIDEIEPAQAIELLNRAVISSREVSGTERNLIEGRVNIQSKTKVVVNSEGVNGSSRETNALLDISSTIGSGDLQCSSWEDYSTRQLSDINPEEVGMKSAKNALALRGAKASEGGEMPLILTPRALWSVLGNGLAPALDARQIQDGKSYLLDSLGDQIASSSFNLHDNAVLPGGYRSRRFDAEGVHSQNTGIIESGVLMSLLHDTNTSLKDGCENTANASRTSYRATPRIGFSNLVVTPGSGNLGDLVSEVKEGVLCTFTFDRPNPVTGELSAMIMEGFFIQNGEIAYPLKNTLFGITMKDLLKRIIRVGSDVENKEGVVSPSLMIESAKITSGN